MDPLIRMWHGGGFWVYPILLLGLFGLAATLVLGIFALAAPSGSRRTLILSTVLCAYGLLVVATGFIGWENSLAKMEEAVAHVNPAEREMILSEGKSEARFLIVFGTAASLPPLLAGVALLGLGVARLRRDSEPVVEASLPRR